jgi:hypothetical protein
MPTFEIAAETRLASYGVVMEEKMFHAVIVLGVIAVCVGSVVTLAVLIYEWLEGHWLRFAARQRPKKDWKQNV